MVHDDETKNAQQPSEPPNRPSYWAEKERRLTAASSGPSQRSPWAVALPIAIVIMVGLIAFLIIWMLLHHGKNASASGASTSAPSVAQGGQSSSSASTATSAYSQSSRSSESAAPGSATSSQPSTATSTVTSTAAPSETSADFPRNVTDLCADYLGSDGGYKSEHAKKVSIGDPGVKLADGYSHNSCDFVHDAAKSVRSSMSDGSSGQSFDVRVRSAWRAANGYKDADVDLMCTTSGGLAHCIGAGAKKTTVDMYVKP